MFRFAQCAVRTGFLNEPERVNRARLFPTFKTDIAEKPIVDVLSIATENQTINPQVEREVSPKDVNFFERAHDSLPD